ncbi:hypothetical protein K470DRAFT_19758 [Piedraia hortae CBS 480.64]|uniref:DUF659 domain-containing protein n=1 Tax=Piedraia hortae CBS 480.64 TaxID=1314780 RepID=A0A6A7BP28_9PEZI|nr:hypothetical protein K470DRAFT_19758 [Piedraia hortae CBS 480.64]
MLDQKGADIMFELGLPFVLFDNPKFRDWITSLNPEHSLPNSKQLAGPMPNASYERLKQRVSNVLFEGEERKRLTLVTDSWTNQRNEPLSNNLLATPDGQSFFYKAVATEFNPHIGAYLAT